MRDSGRALAGQGTEQVPRLAAPWRWRQRYEQFGFERSELASLSGCYAFVGCCLTDRQTGSYSPLLEYILHDSAFARRLQPKRRENCGWEVGLGRKRKGSKQRAERLFIVASDYSKVPAIKTVCTQLGNSGWQSAVRIAHYPLPAHELGR